MKYTSPPKTLPQILVSDSQVKIPSSALSSHPSPYIASSSSPAILSSIVDSNTTTQASNISETFELGSAPSLLALLPMFPILTEEDTNANSTSFQKNQ
jgi:hypothetical protein